VPECCWLPLAALARLLMHLPGSATLRAGGLPSTLRAGTAARAALRLLPAFARALRPFTVLHFTAANLPRHVAGILVSACRGRHG
jgi:hypothetical protein